MLISVITPSFNQARFLPHNLTTVGRQTHPDVEHIVVDPGSTDGSTEIAAKDPKVTLIAEPDRGQSDGITKGFARSKGEILTWLNSDDMYPNPEVLSVVARTFASNPDIDVVYGNVDFVDENGGFLRKGYVNPKADELLKSFHYQVGIVQPGLFMRRRVFDKVGGPSEDFEYCMDYEYWVRIAKAGFKWLHVNQLFAHHRWWDGMKTSRGRGDSLIEHFKVCDQNFGYIHWKWLDRFVDYVAVGQDGIVNVGATIDPERKAELAADVVARYFTQDHYRTVLGSDAPALVETREYVERAGFQRYFYDAGDLDISRETSDDPQADKRVAWNVFEATSRGGDHLRAYHVPNNFDRYFDAGWYGDQVAKAKQSLAALSAERAEVCVIVGNGPSLNKTNLDLLEGYDVIISNYAIINEKLAKTAKILCVVNDLVAKQGNIPFNNHRGAKVAPFWLANSLNPTEETSFVPAVTSPHFNKELGGIYSWRATVSYFNLQVAYTLGYKKVILVGFDHSYSQPQGVREGDAIDQKADDENHFDPRYFRGKVWQAADTDAMEAMYKVAKSAFEEDGREIVNCTVGGRLEVFRRAELEAELGLAAVKTSSAASAAATFPKVLVLDHTLRGDGSATGELKQNLFRDWPADRYLQVSTEKGAAFAIRNNVKAEGSVEGAIAAFDPEIILYRPVPNQALLHRVAMDVIGKRSSTPLAIWIMDDWPTALETDDPAQAKQLLSDLRNLLERSALRLSIGEKMSAVFAARYGSSFVPLANGVEPADWPAPSPRGDAEAFVIRYGGSLAENMTAESVMRVATAVERLPNVRLEIKTRPRWLSNVAAVAQKLERTTFTTDDLPPAEYRAWLSGGDAVLIAYNFDQRSVDYIGLSIANKLPECLASGVPLIAHGPMQAATIEYLSKTNSAVVVDSPDVALLSDAISGLVSDRKRQNDLAAKAREVAFSAHHVGRNREQLRNLLADAARSQKAQRGSNVPTIEMARAQKAIVDETAVVAELLQDRRGPARTMLDVGAHFGTSAAFFHQLGWTVHCFEPDAQNRTKLVAKFGAAPNVTIDTRAVSDKPAKGVSFFSSNESTGISALHAFRDSHTEQGKVDVTTVTEVVAERSLTHVDFLKIDVEGFDFAVIKGVPWDRLQPDVIECEYEDAKTVPMGHTWQTVADYLRERGYAIYVSEWYPIERYGVAHDWRRVVPYPGPSVPADSWGNLLAFRKDPGNAAVQAAFQKALKVRSPSPTQTKSVSPPSTSARQMPAPATQSYRPTSRSKSGAMKQRIGNALRTRALPLFRIAQAASWTLRAASSHKVTTALILLVCAALVAGPFFWPLSVWSLGSWLLAAAIFTLSSAAAVLVEALRRVSARQSKQLASAVGAAGAARRVVERRVDLLEKRLAADQAALRDLQKSIALNNGLTARIESRWGTEKAALLAEFKAISTRLEQRAALATAQVEATIEKSIRPEVARLETSLKTSNLRSNYSNAFRVHDRHLTDSDLEQINSTWLKIFGLSIPRNQLRYMAHQICIAEERAEGRMATTIQAAMLRTLTLLSLQTKAIEVLEIGTLFGIAAGTLYKAAARAGRDVKLTLLDPLEGYYAESLRDAQTGVPVTRDTLVANLTTMGVADADYRIIQKRSHEDEAVKAASDRKYDYLLIDGDHSAEGVAADFDLYGPMVKPGGVVIFDDYDTTDWPAIKPYVDEHVRPNPDWLWIGGGWRTAILRRRRVSGTSDRTVGSESD